MTGPGNWLITHDFADQFGGAERCTAAMANVVLPDARLEFLGGDNHIFGRMGIEDQRVHTILPGGARAGHVHRWLSPVGAGFLRSLRPFEGNVLASTYAFAHWRRAEGSKIVYCHSPLRQIYSGVADSPLRILPEGLRSRALSSIWSLDRKTSIEADIIVATSSVVQERIAEYWGRRPDLVIPPPVDLAQFSPVALPTRDYLLFVGRIVEPYKRLGLLIEAVRTSGERLLVAGEGRDRARLEAISPRNVTFLGTVEGERLRSLYANAFATIFPSVDDFGMVPIESMASGTPVVAFGAGGALDTVIPEVNGQLFHEPTPEALNEALRWARAKAWSAAEIRASVERFSHASYVKALVDVVASV